MCMKKFNDKNIFFDKFTGFLTWSVMNNIAFIK